MLQTIGQILLAILISVLGFAVVVTVCVVILRLLMVVLPGRQETDVPLAEAEEPQPESGDSQDERSSVDQRDDRRSAAG